MGKPVSPFSSSARWGLGNPSRQLMMAATAITALVNDGARPARWQRA